MSGSVAGMGTSGSTNSMKVMELSSEGVGLLSEWLEILGERFQHGNLVIGWLQKILGIRLTSRVSLLWKLYLIRFHMLQRIVSNTLKTQLTCWSKGKKCWFLT